jgi:AraC-like DNA-binding protein
MEWSSSRVPSADITDAWESTISSSYRRWKISRRLPSNFHARVKQHDFAGIGLVETVCDPCTGRRTHDDIQRDTEVYVGIQLATRGRERFTFNDTCIELAAGDVVVWTTDSEVDFEVVERLHKVTLMIPWSRLREHMPERRSLLQSGKIESRTGIGAILAVHLQALSGQIDAMDTGLVRSVSRSTLDFLGVALSSQQPRGGYDANASLRGRIQEYILAHLHEETLSPTGIARANRVSLRHLHVLFHGSGATVSGWIQNRRLLRCREALEDAQYQRETIADIAYRWGFSSTSHFSRVFKEKFGLPPGEVRRRAFAGQIELVPAD